MRTALLLPGTWADHAAFVAACARAGLQTAGAFLVDPLTGAHVEVELGPRSDTVRRAFEGFELEESELAALSEHRSVLRITGDTGDLERLRALTRLSTRLLLHGALGIKVESAGVAAPIQQWLELSVRFDPFTALRCFVVVGDVEAAAYSCGMHNFGLRDAFVEGVPLAEATLAINRFNLYQLVERPALEDGQTFAAEQGARTFVLRKEPCTMWPPDDTFHNPFGMWRLVPGAATTRAS